MFLEGLWLSLCSFCLQTAAQNQSLCYVLLSDLQPKSPSGSPDFPLRSSCLHEKVQKCRMQGHSCCTVDTCVLLMWPDVLETLKGAHGNGCGDGSMHQLQKRHHQVTAETASV